MGVLGISKFCETAQDIYWTAKKFKMEDIAGGDYVCPHCGKKLKYLYCERRIYAIKCDCKVSLVEARSPALAASKCIGNGITVHQYGENSKVFGANTGEITINM